MTTYSLSCCDSSGHPHADCQNLSVGPVKNRSFDPSNDPHFATTIDLPAEIKLCDHENGLTWLHYGDLYKPTKQEAQANRMIANKAGMQGSTNQLRITLFNTIVVQVASRERQGIAIGGRFFAEKSKYNRTGMPGIRNSIAREVFATTDIGCQNSETVVKDRPIINRVIFMTSSDALIAAANNIWQYAANGFPEILPAGLEKEDYWLLHHNLKALEACNDGVEVLFWKVNQEYLAGAVFDVNCRLDDLFNVPIAHSRAFCYCWNCMVGHQHREKTFAKKGREPCPCDPCRGLVAKYGHLKKGATFPLTNNAGIDARVIMEVDGVNSVPDVNAAGTGVESLTLGAPPA